MAESQPSSERWLPVVGHEDRYMVSDHGRVKSLPWESWNGHSWFTKAGKVLRPGLNREGGYRYVNLRRSDRKVVRAYVHHLVLDAFTGPRPDGMFACHNDGNPENNAAWNLRYGSPSENSADMVKHGTRLIGERQPSAKFRDHDIREIRRRYEKDGLLQRELASQYNTTQSMISRIVHRKIWSHL